jgi:hypothetical protein
METRRVHRVRRSCTRRLALSTASVGLLGIAVGWALPRNGTVAVLVLGIAAAGLATIGFGVAAPAASHDRKRRFGAAHPRTIIPGLRRDHASNAARPEPRAVDNNPDDADFRVWAGLFVSQRDSHHGGSVRIQERRTERCALLPARYEAIGTAAQHDTISSRGPTPRRMTGQQAREHGLSRTASRTYNALGTKHIWGLVALIYAYVALFALVVVLRVLGH